jgi:uncharacterized membrane protein
MTAMSASSPGLLRLTHVIYALHACSLVVGIVGAATVVGAFVFGLPSLIAVILNYLKRDAVAGSWLASHFSWQIRTFWFAALWLLISLVLFLSIVGIPLAFAVLFGVGLWVVYRVIKGWLRLNDEQPI